MSIIIILSLTTSIGLLSSASADDKVDPDCTSSAAPTIMAFRPYRGSTYNSAANGEIRFADGTTDTLDPTESFQCFEYVHDGDPSFLSDVESTYGNNVRSIWHGSWATISRDRAGFIEATNPGTINPGFWLYDVGTVSLNGATAGSNTITVQDKTPFERVDDAQQFIPHYANLHYYVEASTPSGTHTYDCDATINGWEVTHQWSNSETVLVTGTGVDASGNDYIEVSSLSWDGITNTYDTEDDGPLYDWDDVVANSGSYDGLWIAPHALTWDNQPKNWAVNLSTESIVSTAPGWEFFSNYVIEYELGARLANHSLYPDGIEFDGGQWRPDKANPEKYAVDVNNDACQDGGYVDEVPKYGIGSVRMLERLIHEAPEPLIVQADSSLPEWGARGYHVLSGIEMENYYEATGEADGFSEAFQHLKTWVEEVDRIGHYDEPVSYGLSKGITVDFGCEDTSGSIEYGTDSSLFRIAFVSNLLLDMPAPHAEEGTEKCFHLYTWDEYSGGDLEDWDWLGSGLEDAQRDLSSLSSTNLLAENISVKTDTCASGSASGGLDELMLDVSGVCNDLGEVPDVNDAKLRVTGFTETVSASSSASYTVHFRARGENHYDNSTDYSDVQGLLPRLVRVNLAYKDYCGPDCSVLKSLSQDVLIPTDGSEQEFWLTFQVPNQAEIWKVEFASGEEPGVAYMLDVGLYSGTAERWSRAFDGGVVLLNMDENEWEYTTSAPSSAENGLRRLSGIQSESDGECASSTGALQATVPAYDALVVRWNQTSGDATCP